MAVRLPFAGLLDELAEKLVLKLGVGQAHLQGTLGQGDVVIDGWSIDGHVNEELTSLRGDDGQSLKERKYVKSYSLLQHSSQFFHRRIFQFIGT